MCVSAAPAEFSGTILYHGRCHHPPHGRVHVVGYQNTVRNFAPGPNAMLLHLPAVGMTQDNFIDTGGCVRVLRDMVNALRPPMPQAYGVAPGAVGRGAPPPVQIFDHDIYTVVLATDSTLIPDALQHVPPHKRIPANRPLFDFYAAMFPGYAVALCCFDNREAASANPLLMWYAPREPGRFVLPALDCHTGAVPDLAATVRTDHWVIVGTDEAPLGWGTEVRYSSRDCAAAPFLPDRVMGLEFTGWAPNGDFEISYDDVLAGRIGEVRRATPGWAAPR